MADRQSREVVVGVDQSSVVKVPDLLERRLGVSDFAEKDLHSQALPGGKVQQNRIYGVMRQDQVKVRPTGEVGVGRGPEVI